MKKFCYLLNHIKEWERLSRLTIVIEKSKKDEGSVQALFPDVKYSWMIYKNLRVILSKDDPKEIEGTLRQFFLTPFFLKWAGKHDFLLRFDSIFTKYKYKFRNP